MFISNTSGMRLVSPRSSPSSVNFSVHWKNGSSSRSRTFAACLHQKQQQQGEIYMLRPVIDGGHKFGEHFSVLIYRISVYSV